MCFRYIHMSTKINKGIWLLLVEQLDLKCVIHQTKRVVDTLQAAINIVEIRPSIDIVPPTLIDPVHLGLFTQTLFTSTLFISRQSTLFIRC